MEYDTQRLIYEFFETLDNVTEICTISGTQAVYKVVRSRQDPIRTPNRTDM